MHKEELLEALKKRYEGLKDIDDEQYFESMYELINIHRSELQLSDGDYGQLAMIIWNARRDQRRLSINDKP